MKIKLLLLVIPALIFWSFSCQKPKNDNPKPIDNKKIEKQFLQFREDYKKARKEGDIAAALKFYPQNEEVLHVRNGQIVWLSYREKTAEYQRTKYASIEDIEGPFVKVTECGCCVWISAKTRYFSEDGEEEEESWIDTYEETDGGWRQTASSNSVDNPRRP